MRVLLGLAALAAGAAAQTVTVGNLAGNTGAALNQNGGFATQNQGQAGYYVGPTFIAFTTGAPYGPSSSATPQSGASVIAFGGGAVNGVNAPASPAIAVTDRINTQTFTGNVNGGTSTIFAEFNYNSLVSGVQYVLVAGKTKGTIQCDPCQTTTCDTSNTYTGPATNTNSCANLTGRVFTITLPTGANQFQIQFYDYESSASITITYSFTINRPAVVLVGDPQIVGMQGQDFQVHGMPDEIFNMVTYPNVQVNARFTYLSEAECPDNYTTCFAHPGTYISEQGLRVGRDKVRVVAGPAKKGLTVHVNGKKVHQKTTHLKLGSVEIVNHRRVVVKTPIAALTMTNSDKFMNQEITMFDEKLIALGANRHVLKAGQSFHPEVPLHGLQGQTWRNVEYPSGLEYEGSIMDYHVVDGNLFGSDFVFNKFAL